MTDKQPEAMATATEYRSTMGVEVLHSWAVDACAALRRQHVELETLTLYKNLADEYGLSIFKDLKDLGDAGSDMQLLRMGYAAARLEIESLRGKGWQSIETAPKDGTLILAAIHIHCSDGTAAWQRHAIYFDAERNITYTDGGDETGWDFDDYQYWMPLPAAPAEGESQ